MSDGQQASEPPAKQRKSELKLTDIQTEILISEVQCRETLWNDQHDNFKNTAVTRKLWNEVGAAFDIPGEEAKKKWKNLKDKYRKIIQKPPPKSGSGAVQTKNKWRFFELMEFTRDTMTHGHMFGSLSKPTDTSLNEEENDDILQNSPNVDEEEETLNPTVEVQEGASSSSKTTNSTTNTSFVYARPHRAKSTRENGLEKEMIQLEKQKIDAILSMQKKNERKQEDGDDYFFFMSLLPYVKQLNPLLKLELRSRIHNDVMHSYRINNQQTAPQLMALDRPSTSLSGYNSPSNNLVSPPLLDDNQSGSSSSSAHYQFNRPNPRRDQHSTSAQFSGLNSFFPPNRNVTPSSVQDHRQSGIQTEYPEHQINQEGDFTTNDNFVNIFCRNNKVD